MNINTKLSLSIVIVTYNNEGTIEKCLQSIKNEIKDVSYEIIIVDNASSDNTIKTIKNYSHFVASDATTRDKELRMKNVAGRLVDWSTDKLVNKSALFNRSTDYRLPVTIISNTSNVGFGKANNQGVKSAKGEFILLLNPDVIIQKISFKKLFDQFNKYKKLGILTVDVVRPDNSRDMACHRGFPTIWRSISYFSRLEKLFSKSKNLSKLFGGYHLLDRPFNQPHFIDSPTAAFYLTKKHILNEVKGFDEDYFMYGEDLDLSYRIAQKGFKALFYPEYKVIHVKYQSGLDSKDIIEKRKTKKYFYEAMRIFYQKHHSSKYPKFINNLVNLTIEFLTRGNL